jgi:hypothetical protein
MGSARGVQAARRYPHTVQSWLRLSEQFPANDKWRSAGFRLLGGTGCWV